MLTLTGKLTVDDLTKITKTLDEHINEPRDVALAKPPSVVANATGEDAAQDSDPQRHYKSAHSGVPRTHLLSNGRYTTMVTAAGSGYSRWHDIAITR